MNSTLLKQLRCIFGQILKFQTLQDDMFNKSLTEYKFRCQYDDLHKEKEEQVQYMHVYVKSVMVVAKRFILLFNFYHFARLSKIVRDLKIPSKWLY